MAEGVVTIVSGGSRGLGLAIVERLLARGDRVATFSRSGSQALHAVASSWPDRVHVEQLDAGDTAALREFVHRVTERFGRVDHCVANAAIATEGVLATTNDAEIEAMLRVNLLGSIVLVRECVRQMLVQKGSLETPSRSGRSSIVVVSSIVATRGSPGLSVYAATKAALEGFVRSLARELGPRGIRVNAVAPGFLTTDLSGSLPEEQRTRIAGRTAIGRLGVPADVVGGVEFLTDSPADFITGQVLTIDGGA